jgi:hypothetical protein
MIVSFATDTAVRQRAVVGTDEYENDVLDWTAPDEIDLTDGTIQPVQASESEQPLRDVVGERWLVILSDPDADVTALDRIVWRGQTYDVDGAPLAYRSGVLDHMEFFIVTAKG